MEERSVTPRPARHVVKTGDGKSSRRRHAERRGIKEEEGGKGGQGQRCVRRQSSLSLKYKTWNILLVGL